MAADPGPTSGAIIASPAPHAPARTPRALHRWFDVGVLFKGAEGLLEMIAGAWLAFDPGVLHLVIFRLTAKELLHDPDDRIAGALRSFAEELGTGRHTFAVVYLIAHGVVKVALAAGLLANKRWAYPFGIAVLLAFAIYQIYRFTHTHAILLPLLSALDLGIAWLVWREWRARASSAPARA
jgi:uncharacterized membrane protein